jgi:drug/metabolite transporter (DMT)-like permease
MIAQWAVFSLCGAVCWGLAYALLNKIMHSGLSAPFVLTTIGCVTLPIYITTMMIKDGMFPRNIALLFDSGHLLALIILVGVILACGQFFIYHAISLKNSAYISIIEITYPLFVVVFLWVLFRDLQMSWSLALGGLLIFSGVTLILLRSGGG